MSAPAPTRRQKRVTSYSPAFPSEEDICKKHAGWSNAKRVAKLIGYVVLRIPVWWRRPGFHDPAFREISPKWHVLRARFHNGQADNWGVVWVAQCGYEYTNDEILGWFLDFRKTAPKKADRCVKCDDALVELKRAAA